MLAFKKGIIAEAGTHDAYDSPYPGATGRPGKGVLIMVEKGIQTKLEGGPRTIYRDTGGKTLAVLTAIRDRPTVIIALHLPSGHGAEAQRIEYLTDTGDAIRSAIQEAMRDARLQDWPACILAADCNYIGKAEDCTPRGRAKLHPGSATAFQGMCDKLMPGGAFDTYRVCLLYTSPSPRD